MAHRLIIGRSGSGKTGLLFTQIEDILKQDKNAKFLIIDIKGDLANLLLHPDNAFNPLIDTYITIPEYKFYNTNFYYITPENKNIIIEILLRKFKMFHYTNSAYISALIDQYKITNLHQLLDTMLSSRIMVNELPEEEILRDKTKLISILNSFLLTDEFKLNDGGIPFDFENLITTQGIDYLFDYYMDNFYSNRRGDKKLKNNITNFIKKNLYTPDNITQFNNFDINTSHRSVFVELAHLPMDKQIYYIANIIYQFKRYLKHRLDSTLYVIIDEVSSLIPPVRKPITHPIIMDLLKKARGFNVEVVFSTQNINDIDYKAIENFESIYVGQTYEKSLKKLRLFIRDISDAYDLEKRQFVYYKQGKFQKKYFSKDTKILSKDTKKIEPVDINRFSGVKNVDDELKRFNSKKSNDLRIAFTEYKCACRKQLLKKYKLDNKTSDKIINRIPPYIIKELKYSVMYADYPFLVSSTTYHPVIWVEIDKSYHLFYHYKVIDSVISDKLTCSRKISGVLPNNDFHAYYNKLKENNSYYFNKVNIKEFYEKVLRHINNMYRLKLIPTYNNKIQHSLIKYLAPGHLFINEFEIQNVKDCMHKKEYLEVEEELNKLYEKDLQQKFNSQKRGCDTCIMYGVLRDEIINTYDPVIKIDVKEVLLSKTSHLKYTLIFT